jgi:hypothetical protein
MVPVSPAWVAVQVAATAPAVTDRTAMSMARSSTVAVDGR